MQLSDNNIHGRTVIAADGLVVGEVDALFVDCESWRVQTLQVVLRKDIADRLGAPRSVFHNGSIEIPVEMVQSVSDTIVLSVPADGLQSVLANEGEPAPVAG